VGLVTASGVPGLVVKLHTYSPAYSRPTSSASACSYVASGFSRTCSSRSAASFRAATCAAAQLSVVARDAHVSPHLFPSSLSQRTDMMSADRPVSSQTACIVAVYTPWPISVYPFRISTPAPLTRMTMYPPSIVPLPSPVLLIPQPMPLYFAVL